MQQERDVRVPCRDACNSLQDDQLDSESYTTGTKGSAYAPLGRAANATGVLCCQQSSVKWGI